MRKKQKPIIFTQEVNPYRHQITVFAGCSQKEAEVWAKKHILKTELKDYLEFIKNNEQLFTEVLNKNQLGYAICHEKKQYIVIILQKFEDTWSYWECLLHELSHVLDWLVEWKLLDGETEARAYLHEWLFNRIRRKIQGVDK